MGMAASQARFLGLTARKSNNEYQAQQINQQRLALSDQQEEIVKRYNEKLNNRMLYFLNDPDTSINPKQLTYWNIVNPVAPTEAQLADGVTAGMGYRLVDVNGNIIVPNYPSVDLTDEKIAAVIQKYDVDETILDNSTLYSNLESGTWVLRAKRTIEEGYDEWFEIPLDEATFLEHMRAENPKDNTDKEYWCWFNKLAPMVNGEYQALTYENLMAIEELELQVYNPEKEQIVVPELSEEDKTIVYGKYFVDRSCIDPKYLEEKLRDGTWYIQTPKYETIPADDENGTPEKIIVDWATTPWQGIEYIEDGYDETDDAAAEAEYEYMMSKFQKQDKMLELQLKQLETEHKAIETELDSVSKVLKDNVESSFKTFA